VLLSAIYLIDEFPHLQFVPWKESIDSVREVADEIIVVHGGKHDRNGYRPAYDYLLSLQDPRIRLFEFPWPSVFDWRQIARSCTFGHLHARGKWCFRVLADEILPPEFFKIRTELESAPEQIKIISVSRWYLLGNEYACPFHDKPLFMRNDKSVGYGTVNPAQGDEASYLLYDDPMDTDHWFDGSKKMDISSTSILRAPDGIDRLLGGETPLGYRGPEVHACTKNLPLGILNVDVNFLPEQMIIEQKCLSQEGYQNLPQEYPHRQVMSPEQLVEALLIKIRGMLERRELKRISLPDQLHEFIDRRNSIHNQVRSLVEIEYGLSWNRISKDASLLRRIRTLATNRLRRFFNWV
jgi:hypothetical protein